MERADKVLKNTYARTPVVFERGEGCWLFDLEGRRYLDPGGGHCGLQPGPFPPRGVAQAVAEQAATLTPHLQHLLYPAHDRAGREADQGLLRRPGLFLQLRGRGQREGPSSWPASTSRTRGSRTGSRSSPCWALSTAGPLARPDRHRPGEDPKRVRPPARGVSSRPPSTTSRPWRRPWTAPRPRS